MKQNIKFKIIILLILLYSCQNKKTEETDKIVENRYTIKISPQLPINDNIVDIAPYLDSIKYVKLELTDNSMIGEVTKVEIYNNRIYILDTKTSSLFIFNMEGTFVNKIHDLGEGPNEYTNLDFFSIDYDNKNIILTDLMAYWIMRYDIEGNFISRQKIPFWIEGLAPIHNRNIALYANFRNNTQYFKQENNLFYIDSIGRIEKKYFSYNSSLIGNRKNMPSIMGKFYSIDNETYFFRECKDTIYHLSPNGLKIKYIFNFNKKGFDNSYFSKTPDELKKYSENGDYYYLCNILENNDFILYEFGKSKEGAFPAIGYYSKKSGHILQSRFYMNGQRTFFNLATQASYNSWFIIPLSASLLLSNNNISKNKSAKSIGEKELINIQNKLTEEDNDVLMMYKIKDF